MRLVRYPDSEGSALGVVQRDVVIPVGRWPSGDEEIEPAGDSFEIKSVELLAPVVPRKIIGIGRNYAAHAKELGNEPPESPLMFLKPSTSVIGPKGTIRLPSLSKRVDYEGELAIVIGREARAVARSDWRPFVLGFCCANDVTARDLQKADVQFTRGKGFDTFSPLGPWIETDLDVGDLRIETRLNGETVQSARTSQMIFDPGQLIEAISEVMTLEPGDVILTGTPEGVGPLSEGDSVEVEVEGIGTLENVVA